MKWSVKTEPPLELEQKLQRKDNTRGFSFLDSHIVLSSPAPEQLPTPQTRVQRQKRNITKALYVMLSTCIDSLASGLYLTDTMKSLLHVMSGEASEIRSALPALLKSSDKKQKQTKKGDSWMRDCGKTCL